MGASIPAGQGVLRTPHSRAPNVDLEHLVVNADGTGDQGKIDEFTYRSWDGGSYFCGCYG